MIIECPYCGKPVVVNGFGRPRLNIPVNKVYDALQRYHGVTAAAKELGCSRGYIYKTLKDSRHASSLFARRGEQGRKPRRGAPVINHLTIDNFG